MLNRNEALDIDILFTQGFTRAIIRNIRDPRAMTRCKTAFHVPDGKLVVTSQYFTVLC